MKTSCLKGLGFWRPQSSQTGGGRHLTAASLWPAHCRRSLPRSGFVVCRACSAARRCKSSTQPDGGEGLAMRKGYRREAMSEGSAEQTCELMDKNRIQGASVGRAGNVLRSPYPSRTRGVDPATVHGGG